MATLWTATNVLAETPTLEVPEQVQSPLAVDVMVRPSAEAGPLVRLIFQRPARLLCFRLLAFEADRVRVTFHEPGGSARASTRVRGHSCLEDPPMETVVEAGVAAPHRRIGRLAFFDPDLPPDPLGWVVPGPPLAMRRFPFLEGSPVKEPTLEGVLLRQRLFLEGPPQLVRALKVDLRPADVGALDGVEVLAWPKRGEPVLALDGDERRLTACTFDGLCLTLRGDLLSPAPIEPATWPSLDRWRSTSYADEKDRADGVIAREALETLARRGGKAAAESLKAMKAYDTCFNGAWRKLDPEADAKRFVLISPSGSARGLDDVIAQRVRTTCKGMEFEKRQRQLAKKVLDETRTDFGSALKLLKARLSSTPSAEPEHAKLPSADVGVVLATENGTHVVKSVLEGSKSGLQPGDLVIAIAGEAAGGLMIEEVVARLSGDPGSEVELEVLRQRRPLTVRVSRTVPTPR